MSKSSDTRTGLAIAGLAACLAAANAGSANAASVGFLWADQPNATSAYAPSSGYSYNSSGGAITVTPISTGFWQVSFAGLGNGTHLNNVQVTAVGVGGGYCTSSGWDASSGKTANMWVSCYDANGNSANNFFNLVYQQRTAREGSASKGTAFLWANQPTTASYRPNPLYSYNSAGGTNTIVRNGTGSYTATIPGLTKTGGDIQVTANNGYTTSAGPVRCVSEGWGSSSAGTVANVQCYDSTGTAADSEFSLSYNIGQSIGFVSGTNPNRGAYAWASNSTKTKRYTPVLLYQHNGFGTGHLTAVETSTGHYTVSIPGSLSYSVSEFLVTGYASANAGYCTIVDWGTSTAFINVACYAQGGTLQSSDFDVSFVTH